MRKKMPDLWGDGLEAYVILWSIVGLKGGGKVVWRCQHFASRLAVRMGNVRVMFNGCILWDKDRWKQKQSYHLVYILLPRSIHTQNMASSMPWNYCINSYKNSRYPRFFLLLKYFLFSKTIELVLSYFVCPKSEIFIFEKDIYFTKK